MKGLTITGTSITLDVAASRVAALALKQLIAWNGWETHDRDELPVASEARKLLAATLEDRVLVASDGTAHAVIAYEGGLAMDYEVDAVGKDDLLDHMGPPPCAGLWIYAGKLTIRSSRGWEGDWDEETTFTGEYRRATEADLQQPGHALGDWDGMWEDDAAEAELDVEAVRAAHKAATAEVTRG